MRTTAAQRAHWATGASDPRCAKECRNGRDYPCDGTNSISNRWCVACLARTAVPALLAEVEELTTARAADREEYEAAVKQLTESFTSERREKFEIIAERDDARAALRLYVEYDQSLCTDGATIERAQAMRMAIYRALAGTTAPVAVPAPDPVQAAQREGSVTHTDLMAVRERYGELYVAVFPLVPAFLRGVSANQGVHAAARREAERLRAQVEACK